MAMARSRSETSTRSERKFGENRAGPKLASMQKDAAHREMLGGHIDDCGAKGAGE